MHVHSVVLYDTISRKYTYDTVYIWCQYLMMENIDKLDEFLVICQNFPYQTFLLALATANLQLHQYFIHEIFLNVNSYKNYFPYQKFVPYN